MDKHSFPLQEEATEQTPYMDSAYRSNFSVCMQSQAAFFICKTRKTIYFPKEYYYD